MLRKLTLITLVLCMIVPSLTGCTAKKIFVTEEEKYMLIPVKDTDLSTEIYYVKDGAKFYETYTPDGKAASSGAFSRDQYYWLTKDITLIPSLYSDELIAYSSSKTSDMSSIEVERYYDVGYSIGIYGGSFDTDGYYCINLNQNVVKKSSAFKALSTASSKDIRIASVNDMPIDERMLNDGGIFIGIEKGETCEIGYYAGTFYETAIITSDYYFLQSYETLYITQVQSTKNGYLALMMPEDAKSGYYKVKNGGMFKYYSHEKGDKLDKDSNMNEQNYIEGQEDDFEYAQQYSLAVGSKTYNVKFQVEYEVDSVKESDIKITLVSPLGIKHELKAENGLAEISFTEVEAGKWTLYAYPRTMEIQNIDAISAAQDPDAKKEEFVFEVSEDEENTEFFCMYEGNGSIWGTVTNEYGEAQVLEKKKKDGKYYMGTTYSYLPKGTYTMTIYHYMDTVISETDRRFDSSNEEEEIIYIEE